jgi:hypothetical protein
MMEIDLHAFRPPPKLAIGATHGLIDNLSDELIACKKLAESWDCASLRGIKVLLIINIVK